MTSKERAYLRGLANRVPSLYQVGKDGITENVIKQIDDALEARELIKGNVLENSMMSAREVAEELAAATSSQVVQVIGNRFILYRRTKKNLCEM
ncbi:MAG: ribosome assembly RNA-binding protein YhbY [Clostridia bacterium]|nr:ribosome assembly RNA-binding protein YhbY [Clostridia bacterium]